MVSRELRSRFTPHSAFVLLATLCCLPLGCGPTETGNPALHPVGGVVTRGGKPIADALIRLSSDPPDTKLTITGASNAEGRFELSTFSSVASVREAGAPLGTFRVTIDLPLNADQSGGGAVEYPAPVTIVAGENTLELKLP